MLYIGHFSRAYELWTEEFLISEYGNLTVRLESRAESSERVPSGETGVLGRDTVRHFIQNYQTRDAYVISQVPQPMERDIGIPPCLRYYMLALLSILPNARTYKHIYLFLTISSKKRRGDGYSGGAGWIIQGLLLFQGIWDLNPILARRGEGGLCMLLVGGVPLQLWNPYTIPGHVQLHFVTLL